METPFSASATSAGALISASTFVVPPYQREYAWERDEIREFWDDLSTGLSEGSYFLGLVILTDEGRRKHVVDGQQRLLSLTLLAACLYHEALRAGRKALADRIHSDFLTSIDYSTDAIEPRVQLSDSRDDRTLQAIISDPYALDMDPASIEVSDLAGLLLLAARDLQVFLREDLASDPFKRLGQWTDFLTNHLYLAVFVHPDPASAYRVFEVINTRGRELTTADLLKNYVLSQTTSELRDSRYQQWQSLSRPLLQYGQPTLVQYIRHVVTVVAGHIPPRDLFAFLADRNRHRDRRRPPSVDELMKDLQEGLPLYLQIVDPTLDGPADPAWLSIFAAFQDLNVIVVRPLLMAISEAANPTEGMRRLLELVVRRIVVGNLGTGNVERRLGEAAFDVKRTGKWEDALAHLRDLNPPRAEFVEQVRKRSYNKGSLAFLRRSLVQASVSPERHGFLHLVRPRQAIDWPEFPDEDFTYWGSTLGNTVLATTERRPHGSSSFDGLKVNLLPYAVNGEDVATIGFLPRWGTDTVEKRGAELAALLGDIWFA